MALPEFKMFKVLEEELSLRDLQLKILSRVTTENLNMALSESPEGWTRCLGVMDKNNYQWTYSYDVVQTELKRRSTTETINNFPLLADNGFIIWENFKILTGLSDKDFGHIDKMILVDRGRNTYTDLAESLEILLTENQQDLEKTTEWLYTKNEKLNNTPPITLIMRGEFERVNNLILGVIGVKP